MKIQRKRFARLLASDANFEKNLLKSAYHLWLKDYQFKHIDVQGLANVTDLKGNFQNPQIKNCRRALYFSAGEMAKRLSMSRASYQDIEKREVDGSVSLHILNKVARAMNCDLYYCIRPKDNKTFSEAIWQQLVDEVLPQYYRQRRLSFAMNGLNPVSEQMIFLRQIQKTERRPHFRKSRGWGRNCL